MLFLRCISLFVIFFVIIFPTKAQIPASQLIDKSIIYHDPGNNWNKLKAHVEINSVVDRKGVIDSSFRSINMDLSKGFFEMSYKAGDDDILMSIDKDNCIAKLVNQPNATAEQLKEKNVNCERVKMYNSYFRYLLGMPMKLKDPGTIIENGITQKTYKDKVYDVVTVNYDPEVGTYTWLFYFDQKTAELVLMEFSKDGSFENGETIELNNKVKYQKMILPGQLVWYVLPDRPFLAEENIQYSKL